MLPVATDYKDAILIQRSVIETENRRIFDEGTKKVTKMESIMRTKGQLAGVMCTFKKLKLEIEDY